MKIKAIESICKANKTILLGEAGGVQWISDGAGCYPLHGLPILDEGNVFTIFDIPEDKRNKFFFDPSGSFLATPDISDTVPGEQQLEQGKLALFAGGRVLLPLKTASGLVFINNKHLAPFNDSENGVVLFERIDKRGKTYIAVKEGFILVGIIYPLNVITKELVEELEALSKLALVAALNGEYKDKPEQLSFGNYSEEENEET